MIPWTMEDVNYTYPWAAHLPANDRGELLDELNHMVERGLSPLDDAWSEAVDSWQCTAAYWHDYPDEALNLARQLGETDQERKMRHRHELYRRVRPALLQIGTAVPVFGTIAFLLWLNAYPSTAQTLTGLLFYIYTVSSWFLWGGFIKGFVQATRKRKDEK
jgi:hypothetical protein